MQCECYFTVGRVLNALLQQCVMATIGDHGITLQKCNNNICLCTFLTWVSCRTSEYNSPHGDFSFNNTLRLAKIIKSKEDIRRSTLGVDRHKIEQIVSRCKYCKKHFKNVC